MESNSSLLRVELVRRQCAAATPWADEGRAARDRMHIPIAEEGVTDMETLDFEKLSLRDALDLAILIEEEAGERYLEFAQQMENQHTTEAARFFRTMVANENKHGEELAERRRALFGEEPRRVDRSLLWDVEAPEYEKARAFMSDREALEVALESERKAQAFFAEAMKHVSDLDVKRLFTQLREEEVLHEKLVARELSRLAPPSDIDPSDYADEPVAQ
jgi:erythrin-vacuolar iron transport family protein